MPRFTHTIKYKNLFARYGQCLAQELKQAEQHHENSPSADDPRFIEADALAILGAYSLNPLACTKPAEVPKGAYPYPHLEPIEEYMQEKKDSGRLTAAGKEALRLLMEPLSFRLSSCLAL